MSSPLTSSAGWVWAALVAAMVLTSGRSVHAQALEPRSYANTPVGINFLLLGYGHTEGDVGFDESTPVKDARVRIDAGVLAYARSLDVWGLSGKVLAVLPFAEASGSATVKGQGRDRDVFGLGDPLLRVSVNFYGAPALSLNEFARYRQDLIIGASLQVTAPLGQYDSSKLLNVGTNRWSVKPELGLSHPAGRWFLEGYAGAWLFGDNADFFGGSRKEQQALASLQAHVSYVFKPRLWLAGDATFYTGGRTTLDGVRKADLQRNTRLGLTLSVPVKRRGGLKVSWARGILTRVGGDFDTLALGYQFLWF